jgi:hypothetical protein
MNWDVFVSHAFEDKEFARAIADSLSKKDLKVWFDEFELHVGDSLRRSIDKGLSKSRFGIVVLSPSFFAKEWTQKELDALTAREIEGKKIILPIWHNISAKEIRKYSPLLADKLAIDSSLGIKQVIDSLVLSMEHALNKRSSKEAISKSKQSLASIKKNFAPYPFQHLKTYGHEKPRVVQTYQNFEGLVDNFFYSAKNAIERHRGQAEQNPWMGIPLYTSPVVIDDMKAYFLREIETMLYDLMVVKNINEFGKLFQQIDEKLIKLLSRIYSEILDPRLSEYIDEVRRSWIEYRNSLEPYEDKLLVGTEKDKTKAADILWSEKARFSKSQV